jgi:hypothetical protein
LENQESIGFIKATKILMNKNSTDITKIREFFEKYGYNPRVKENSGLNNFHLTAFGSVLKVAGAGHWWLTPVILASWEAEFRGLRFEASLGKIVQETLSSK